MKIVGLGIDIIAVNRVLNIVNCKGNRLANHILTDTEKKIWQQHKKPVYFLAKRFAVKEAASKALGIGMRNGIRFNQFEIKNDALGKPKIQLLKKARALAKKLKVKKVHVTISDECSYACAVVILEG